MTPNSIPMLLWWLAILWTYTELFPRPFDDWKNTLLYGVAGILVIAFTIRRKITGPVAAPPAIFFLIAAAYFLLCTLSIVVAKTGRYEGLLELARLILWVGLAWVFSVMGSRTWLWLMRVTVVSAAAIAILTWLWSRGADVWPYVTPFLAPIGHITYYGDFMAMSLVMAVGLAACTWASPSPPAPAKALAGRQPSPVGRGGIIWIL